jgi:hypothetical protein
VNKQETTDNAYSVVQLDTLRGGNVEELIAGEDISLDEMKNMICSVGLE